MSLFRGQADQLVVVICGKESLSPLLVKQGPQRFYNI